MSSQRKYFIVKHGLDSLEALPGFIWNTGKPRPQIPHRYKEIKKGDRWVAFAYTSNDRQDKSLRLITGFYKCTRKSEFRPIPMTTKARRISNITQTHAWMIEGKPDGKALQHPVRITSIDSLLRKRTFSNQTITPISPDGYRRIRAYVSKHQPPPADIRAFGGDASGSDNEVYAAYENRRVVRTHLARERDGTLPVLRKQKDNFQCQICGMSFVEAYGEVGRCFAEAHHIVPLGKLRHPRRTTIDDLITVCANCHRMLHRMHGKATDVSELRRAFEKHTRVGTGMSQSQKKLAN